MLTLREIGHYLTFGYLYGGALIALEITAASFLGGLLIALVLATMRESRYRPIRLVATAYIWIWRGTPILLQLIFLYDVMPNLGIRLTPIPTAILAFSLNEGAFQCELVRGGLHSVSANQVLAAESLGMSRFTILRRILIPQALRAIIPPYGNEIVNLLKNTSLASVIAVSELTQRSEAIASSNFQFIPVFIAAGCMYLAMTTIVAAGQSAMERYTSMSRGPKQPRNEELITEQNKRGAGWEPVKFPGSEDRFPGIENRSYLYRIRAIYAERTEGARVQRTRA